MSEEQPNGNPPERAKPSLPPQLRNHPVDAGIWYWVWFGRKRGWELWAFRADVWGDSGHPALWRAEVAPALAQVHRLSASKARALQELPYAMPRGRLSRALEDMEHADVRRGTWLLLHGGDAPTAIDVGSAEGMILNEFGLNVMAARDLTRWLADEHERMLPADQCALGELLGKRIPY